MPSSITTKIEMTNPYDQFQKKAVDNVLEDFSNNPAGRFLLVIPTGGGKTITAIKTCEALVREGVITEERPKILWIAHRTELLTQAEDSVKKLADKLNLSNFVNRFIFASNNTCIDEITKWHNALGFIVIDEAHHATAETYKPLFNRKNVPILGLTATPSRHDNQPLPFERESFSIGIPELIEKGILIKPEIISIKGEQYGISDLDNLEALNCDERNKKIVGCLRQNTQRFNKVVIFAATKNHAEDLTRLLRQTELEKEYAISYIDGNGNSERLSREEYIRRQKLLSRSIIVNVQVLTEGYDDPKINCVLIAAPTKSKLFYMQAAGRALRLDQGNDQKRAYIIEIEDDLPNIRYRIDNRWLFADISDWLEPAVRDFKYNSANDLRRKRQQIQSEFQTKTLTLDLNNSNGAGQLEFLLFKEYESPDSLPHLVLPLNDEFREQYLQFFNALSERLVQERFRLMNQDELINIFNKLHVGELATKKSRDLICNAMVNTQSSDPKTRNFAPWITYLTISKETNQMSDENDADLSEIEVETSKLVLDPNNPRFLTDSSARVNLEETCNPDIVERTYQKMLSKSDPNFKVESLKENIIQNGYRPVDRIFVREIPNTEYYLVLEGNRRVTAIRSLLGDENQIIADDLRRDLERIKVVCISNKIPEKDLQGKISRILGIRHHGSPRKWTPFAQARNIFEHYSNKLSSSDFRWEPEIAKEIANSLSITEKEVKERLRVYLGMKQIQDALTFDNGAKMQHRYYSVLSEILNTNRKGLTEYIRFDDLTFTLDEESINRLDAICYFSKPNRKDGKTPSPIHEPTQWRALNNILLDDNPDKRAQNLHKVEVEKRSPDDVWAERSEELNAFEWSKFLTNIQGIVDEIPIGQLSTLDTETFEKAKNVILEIKQTLKNL